MNGYEIKLFLIQECELFFYIRLKCVTLHVFERFFFLFMCGEIVIDYMC